ncbi:MAG: retroviral-like aspartic protease [Anaerolineae bacterium]|nr:retroviral-like aspartic protease [Anaerolineae bacterium]
MRLAYTTAHDELAIPMPRLPLRIHYGKRTVEVVGLIDTGSTVNVLPYPVGIALSAVWDEQESLGALVGSLSQAEARSLMVFASHPQLTADKAVRFIFAWTQAQDVPVILGQVNFFQEFDVCFYRSQNVFEVNLRTNP